MTSIVVYDDAQARQFAPFSLTRPLAGVRSGTELIGQRWVQAFGATRCDALSSPHLDGFIERDTNSASGVLAPGTIVANARCVISLGAHAAAGDVWRVGEEIAAVRLAKPIPVEAFRDGSMDLDHLVGAGAERTLNGRWLNAPWDLIGQLTSQLSEDLGVLISSGATTQQRRTPDIGDHPVVIEAGVHLEPQIVFDTSAGPIYICAGAHVNAFSRIAGPCYIGRGTHILGGRISGSAIGDDCRIHGDLGASIFFGHGNKAHEGFVGHSVMGRWANLGAGTTTSNLKNSYGSVRMWSPEGERDTGLMFLGSLIGDHAKLGIGTMLGTGTVVGAGANVFGTMRPPKHVPPFAWGDAAPYETFALPKFLEVAAKVMERRSIALDPHMQRVLSGAHELSASDEW